MRVAIVNDYSVVVRGLAAMFDETAAVEIVEIDAGLTVDRSVDIALFDTFAHTDPDLDGLRRMVADPNVGHVVVYSWDFDPDFVERAIDLGASGFLSKKLDGGEIVDALERVRSGELVVSTPPDRARAARETDSGWRDGLSEREAEVLAHITQGKSNVEIAELLHLSVNTIKGNIRTAYRKIGVVNRVEAVIWGRDHGMEPDRRRVVDPGSQQPSPG